MRREFTLNLPKDRHDELLFRPDAITILDNLDALSAISFGLRNGSFHRQPSFPLSERLFTESRF
jgi:hypothetical protein